MFKEVFSCIFIIIALVFSIYGHNAGIYYSDNTLIHSNEIINMESTVGGSTDSFVQLALNSMALPTFSEVSKNFDLPVIADVFNHVSNYLIVLSDRPLPSLLPKLIKRNQNSRYMDIHLSDGYQSINIPYLVSSHMKKYTKRKIKCAGNYNICSSVQLNDKIKMTNNIIDKSIMTKNQELTFDFKNNEKDKRFLNELQDVFNKYLNDKGIHEIEIQSFYTISFMTINSLDSESKRNVAVDIVTNLLFKIISKIENETKKQFGLQLFLDDPLKTIRQTTLTIEQEILFLRRRLLNVATNNNSANNLASTTLPKDGNSTATINSTVTNIASSQNKLTMNDIETYQIILWTAIILFVLLLFGIYSIANMETKRDSLLYAKFQTEGHHRKTD